VPGLLTGNKRTIWQIPTVKVFDGGADGVAATPDNTLFETSGLFVP
jgi:hypothetical protein